MKKAIHVVGWQLLFVLILIPAIFAQTGAIQGHSFLGGTQAKTSGLSSTNYLDGIVPAATITVYLTGTTTLATIYENAAGATLSNPFTSNAVGSANPGGWIFWAATNQGLDVVLSGGGGNASCTTAPNCYPQPVTITDVFPSQSFTPSTGVASAQGTSPIEVNGQSSTPEQGALTISCPTCANLDTLVQAPVTGQYVVVYPSASTGSSSGQGTVSYANSSGAVGSIPLVSPSQEAGAAGITWSNPQLPSYVTAANVTAVYAFALSSAYSLAAPTSPDASCGGTGEAWTINEDFSLGITASGTGATSVSLKPR